MLTRPAPIGGRRLPDLKDRDPRDLMHQTSLRAARHNWRAPIAVQAQHSRNPAQRKTAGG
jgi:hypothetical protein